MICHSELPEQETVRRMRRVCKALGTGQKGENAVIFCPTESYYYRVNVL